MLTTTTKLFLDLLLERLDQLLKRHSSSSTSVQAKFAAFWDLDGTLIDGDISEGCLGGPASRVEHRVTYLGMLDQLITARLIPGYEPEARGKERLWQEYARLRQVEGDLVAFAFLAEVLADFSPEQHAKVEALLAPLVANYYRPFVIAESLYLLEALSQRGVQHFVISASPHLLVTKCAGMLPIPVEQMSGIERSRRAGVLIDPLINHAEGKRQRAELLTHTHGLCPVFAAGNTWNSDGAMLRFVCEQGGQGLMITHHEAPSWAADLAICQLRRS